MKQTTNYQFNLIESGDTFSPNPLNENMEKVEAALTGLDTDLSGQIAAAVTAMGSGGSTARIAYGSYTGDGASGYSNPKTLSFGFKPLLFAVYLYSGQTGYVLVRGTQNSLAGFNVTWGDTSVSYYADSSSTMCNQERSTYHYVAIGE